jgi:hypothetical protein
MIDRLVGWSVEQSVGPLASRLLGLSVSYMIGAPFVGKSVGQLAATLSIGWFFDQSVYLFVGWLDFRDNDAMTEYEQVEYFYASYTSGNKNPFVIRGQQVDNSNPNAILTYLTY